MNAPSLEEVLPLSEKAYMKSNAVSLSGYAFRA